LNNIISISCNQIHRLHISHQFCAHEGKNANNQNFRFLICGNSITAIKNNHTQLFDIFFDLVQKNCQQRYPRNTMCSSWTTTCHVFISILV